MARSPGVAASLTTGARAAAPFAAALYAGLAGYSALLWTLSAIALVATWLAYDAERRMVPG